MSQLKETENNISPVNFLTMNGNNKSNKKKLTNNQTKMINMRVIQKQLVYVIGLSSALAYKDVKYFYMN